MSNNVSLQELLKAVDRATRPLNALQNASLTLASDIRDAQTALGALDEQAGRIDGFRKANARLATTEQSLAQAKQQAAALAVQFKNTQNPTQAQADALTAARKSAVDLKHEYNSLRYSVQRQRTELAQAGVNTRTLSSDERRLKSHISEKTQQLNRQRDALARVNQQQERLSTVQNRYESGKRVTARVRQLANTGVGIAKAGFDQTSRFIAPGISFEKQMSAIQANLGLAKGDSRLEAIRQQAREVSAGTGVPADTVLRAQTELARSGYDADGLLAATAPTVNLSLAGSVDAAKAADMIASTQAAYSLADTDAGRIADVLTRGFTSSNTSLAEMVAAVTSAAPAADAAGMGLEETTALLGVLAEKGMKGAVAGDALSAMLRHVQAPAAIKASGALASAAGDGSLDEKRQQLQGAKGSTALAASAQTDNLDGDINRFQAAWNGLKIDVFDKADGALRNLITTATGWLGTASLWVNANPELTQTLASIVVGAQAFAGVLGGVGTVIGPVLTGVNMVITAAGMLGTVFSVVGGAIMTVLGALSWPVIALGAAIAAGALLIFKYWEPISAFFGGVMEGLSTAFAPLGALFSPVMAVFDSISEKLGGIWQWFTDLITPIKATLDGCKNAGVIFGQALGDALMAPLDLFNSLSGKASWLLEKLGIIKNESGDLDAAAAKAEAASSPSGSAYIPGAGISGGSLGYQPTIATGGRSYVDQSKSEYHITLQGGTASGTDLTRQIREEIENSERDKARQRQSSFMYV
ncbi:TPA: phage tail tape measure protein [Enterobacter asburiae]|uniref:phage tail tape measure protein n=1 Tax=Enterobacter asburiae TaxID=61645 RepID=UPI00079BB731|nr:phage tail tape measure protein [Enterobacter asburiae]SAF78986.1 phage Tail Tape Measure protein [Enterobacter cloacae]MDL4612374.1 phage tail tape measure protein [Enterobacter asburiae]HCM9127441.1 phage tail tape measure protein [Enterobacter asburiae]HDW1997490.1 phage tail tape measure protein [Enterobacter asburiae]HED1590442.1 phage tail tape measure protein [Enterobacter asburiae]